MTDLETGRVTREAEVVLYAEFTAKLAHVREVEDLILAYAEVVRSEPGNDLFEVYRKSDSTQFVVFEKYRDRAAFDAHLAAAEGQTFNDALAPLVEGSGSELTFLTRLDKQ